MRELFAAFLKLTDSSFEISGLQMIEGCSYLDEPLDKNPVQFPVFMPKIFKDFVRLEKPLAVELLQPTVKSLIHHTIIIANRANKFKAKSLLNLGISNHFSAASCYR